MHASDSAEGPVVDSDDEGDQFYGELRDGDEMLDDLEGARQWRPEPCDMLSCCATCCACGLRLACP